MNSAQKKRLAIILIIIVTGGLGGFFVYTTFFAPSSPPFAITYPRFGMPTITALNDTVSVEVTSIFAIAETEWTASIASDYYGTNLAIDSVSQDGSLYTLNITIPEETPIGLYNLSIQGGEHSDTEIHAVSVVQEIKETFSFIQITDIHVLPETEAFEDFYQFNRYAIPKIIQEINLIHPDFVILTGDITNDGTTAQYDQLTKYLMELEVPIFIVVGNHAYFTPTGKAEYLERYSPLYYSFDYGGCHFVMLHSGGQPPSVLDEGISEDQIQWFEEDLAAHESADITFVAMHHPVFGDAFEKNNEAFRNLCDQYNVDMVLSGHKHTDRVYNADGTLITNELFPSGTIYVETTTGGKVAGYDDSLVDDPQTGYRLVQVHEGEVVSYTYDYNHDGNRDPVLSIPFDNLTVSYTTNDGTLSSVTATINNLLWEEFNHGQLTFHVAGSNAQKTHGIINGIPVHYLQQTGTATIWAQTTIAANNNTVVQVVPGYYHLVETQNQNQTYLTNPTNTTVLYNLTQCRIASHTQTSSSEVITLMSNGSYHIATSQFQLTPGETIDQITVTYANGVQQILATSQYQYFTGTGVLTIRGLSLIPSLTNPTIIQIDFQ